MTAPRIISLGDGCTTAFQLRRITGVTTLSVMDWLFTPAEALGPLIETDFAKFFLPENMAVMEDKEGVIDRSYGVTLHHDFRMDANGVLTPEGFAKQVGTVAARYRKLVELWCELHDRDELIFARATRGGDTSFTELYALLRRHFKARDISLLFYRRGVQPNVQVFDDIVVYDVMDDAGPAPDYWQGCDAQWDAAVQALVHRRS